MMRSACLSLAILGLAACSAPDAIETSAQAPVAAPSDAELLARGDYLVRIAGCNDCHTPAYGERGGNVAMMWALMGTVLIGLVGLTVDFTRAQSIRNAMQNAADGAALVAERSSNLSIGQRTAAAREKPAARGAISRR